MSSGRERHPRGRIEISGIHAYGKHGADPGERDTDQPFTLDVVLNVDLSLARRSDALGDSIDYAAVAARVVAIVRDRSYRLLERLGDELLRELATDERVKAASVKVAKPGILGGATPSITVFYERPEHAAARP